MKQKSSCSHESQTNETIDAPSHQYIEIKKLPASDQLP